LARECAGRQHFVSVEFSETETFMLSRRTRTYFAAFAAAALSASSAAAAVVTYTPTAVAGGTWADALTTPSSYVEASGFEDNDLINPVLNVVSYGQFIAWGSAVGTNNATFTTLAVNSLSLVTAQNPTLNISAPSGGNNASLLWLGTNAVGSGQFSAEPLTITLTDVNGVTTTYSLTTGATSPAFWGFTSDTAINTITVVAPTGYDADLMDFYAGTYDASTPTAECATLFLVGGGLVFLGVRRKLAGRAAY
jgi:hypothetical protein